MSVKTELCNLIVPREIHMQPRIFYEDTEEKFIQQVIRYLYKQVIIR